MDKLAIKLENVSMHFRKSTQKINSFKEYFIKKVKKQIAYEEFIALNNVNLSIKKGEVVGFIGLNGAGKSTLLKVVSRVQKPTTGNVVINGKVSPLLELGAGFDNDLTGRENIYLNGLILGYNREFISKKVDEIINFAELKEFIDVPIKNYSSGMKARLGFSIATVSVPEILIVDEVLSVGDGRFRKKSEERMLELIKSDATVLFVSHSLAQIRRLCTKVVWLEKGEIKMIGDTKEICDSYEAYL
ncbi:teichoic acid ABC transporter ATP-binding protein [Clostridium botulinum]|uniref:ABC transporter ATP-binding protein n=1 Tax=Clostridium botulinum TaxID=1491 RepID=UPI000174E24E|nr:ABC transporter ATP-binding protein [Clostridium botulinum]ACD51472.1 O-antigen export system ATP-binding protein [Clostridium botulinum E3 str. Alaska E43]AJF30805.1 teichoic acid ABC transporter ATP-binding protein [Clostridium botulinum]AJF33868.1 teichoic acid ABC transporter ATP-binding protein [Clostridium botulinum]MBN1036687.1 ABC transporter ATP-binding protein [Clostridium botulinum]MBY6787967.1 ABC transporter ATP-binding protein [Clostridium botulinum]